MQTAKKVWMGVYLLVTNDLIFLLITDFLPKIMLTGDFLLWKIYLLLILKPDFYLLIFNPEFGLLLS